MDGAGFDSKVAFLRSSILLLQRDAFGGYACVPSWGPNILDAVRIYQCVSIIH